jgi:hypothetical protein
MPSHNRSCGQTREQISGMLLVDRDTAAASINFPSAAKPSHSGILLPKGQPVEQKGIAHWMHRLACSRTDCSSNKP